MNGFQVWLEVMQRECNESNSFCNFSIENSQFVFSIVLESGGTNFSNIIIPFYLFMRTAGLYYVYQTIVYLTKWIWFIVCIMQADVNVDGDKHR